MLTIEHDEDSHIRVDDEVIESDSSDDQENEEDQGFVSRQEIQPSDEEVPQSPSTQEQDTIKLLQSSGTKLCYSQNHFMYRQGRTFTLIIDF